MILMEQMKRILEERDSVINKDIILTNLAEKLVAQFIILYFILGGKAEFKVQMDSEKKRDRIY